MLLGLSGASTDGPELAKAAFQLASTPLSVTALISGLVLGLRGTWGVLCYPWVTIKLGLLIATILSGALAIGPSAHHLMDHPTDGAQLLIAGAVFNVAALVVSTALSVYKPGKQRVRRATAVR